MIKYKELKIGDVFYEYGSFSAVRKFKVIEEPTTKLVEMLGNDLTQWTWVGESEDGVKVHFAVTEGLEHYGPKLSYSGDDYYVS